MPIATTCTTVPGLKCQKLDDIWSIYDLWDFYPSLIFFYPSITICDSPLFQVNADILPYHPTLVRPGMTIRVPSHFCLPTMSSRCGSYWSEYIRVRSDCDAEWPNCQLFYKNRGSLNQRGDVDTWAWSECTDVPSVHFCFVVKDWYTTLFDLAPRFGFDWQTLCRYNGLVGCDCLGEDCIVILGTGASIKIPVGLLQVCTSSASDYH